MDPEQADETLAAISRAAGQRIMLGKHDTLAGAVLALTMTFTVQWTAVDRAGRPKSKRATPFASHEPPPTPDLSSLSVAELQLVRQGMNLLNGVAPRDSEPPKPLPPESLEDLRVGHATRSSDLGT